MWYLLVLAIEPSITPTFLKRLANQFAEKTLFSAPIITRSLAADAS